jgi:general stress protein 26
MEKYMFCTNNRVVGYFIAMLMFLFSMSILAQEVQSSQYNRDTLITAAKEIMKAKRYCALITLDESGQPQVRTMDPFPPEDDLVVWLGTNSKSRKVKEIQKDSRATLYYEALNGVGYVVIKGHAYLIDEKGKKTQYWKEEWDAYYANQKSNYILIKVIPDELKILDNKHGITGDSLTWAVPTVKFKLGK